MENSDSKPSSKLIVFQTIKKNFITFGFSPNLISQAYPFNKRILLHFLIHGLGAISTFVFILCEAKNFIEYTQTIYMFSLSILIIITMANMTLKVNELFDLLNGGESIANTSK